MHSDLVPLTYREVEDFNNSFQTREEFEIYFDNMADSLLIWHSEKVGHNRDGYYAHEAYSPQCLALGHTPELDEFGDTVPEYEDSLAEADIHAPSWDGGYLCAETKYSPACSECEGGCDFDYMELPLIWDLVKEKK